MLTITQDLLTNRRNRPYLRDAQQYAIRQLKGVVAHWTANTDTGANAQRNRNYFNITERFASAHYIVDDSTIIQCIPDNELAYHVGSAYYRPDGETIIAGTNLTPNYYLIGVEMCVNADGDWNATYRNAVGLYAHLLHKYRLTVYDIYRHYDITGKDCPKMMLNETDWWSLRRDISAEMAHLPETRIGAGKVTASWLNVRSGPGTENPVRSDLKQNALVSIYETRNGWHRIGNRQWVGAAFIEILNTTQLAEITETTGANVRSGPGTDFDITDALPHGVLCDVFYEKNNWYNIGHNQWIYAPLARIVNPAKGRVAGADTLNVRSGPATSFRIVRRLHNGDSVFIFEENNNWLRVGMNQWVYGGYVVGL